VRFKLPGQAKGLVVVCHESFGLSIQEKYTMATRQEAITPLIIIDNIDYVKQYERGLSWRMNGWRFHGEVEAQGPLRDSYLFDNLKTLAARNMCNGQNEDFLYQSVCFFIGMIHGGIISPDTNQLRPDITTLVLLTHKDATRGYRVGRDYFFNEAEPHERQPSVSNLVARFRELAKESAYFYDTDETWYYTIGCILGEISGTLFPYSHREQLLWEEDCRTWLAQMQNSKAPESHTEPLSIFEALQET
jgi:hypothetical protein